MRTPINVRLVRLTQCRWKKLSDAPLACRIEPRWSSPAEADDCLLHSKFPIPLRRISTGEQTCRLLQVNVLHQHAFLAVWQMRHALARRSDDAGRRFLVAERVVDA